MRLRHKVHQIIPAHERPKGPLEILALVLLVMFLLLAPFPYGGIMPRGTLQIQLFAFIITALAFASRGSGASIGRGWIPAAAVAGIALVGAVQLVPLPRPLLEGLSPSSAAVYRETNQILTLFGREPVTPKISITPADTRSTALLAAAFAALFVSTARLAHSRFLRRLLISAICLAALVHLIRAASEQMGLERLRGPFINPNHLAGYLLIALSAAFGILWREVLKNRERAKGARDLGEALEKRIPTLAGAVLLWAIFAIGIGLTRSRGGIAAAAITTLVLFIVAVQHQTRRRQRTMMLFGLSLLAGILVFAAIAQKGPLIRFLASDPRDLGSDMRPRIWSISIEAWQNYPILGSGLGSFREAFRQVQPRDLQGLVEQAHNDPLQLLVTGGALGFALGAIALVSMLALLIRRWHEEKRREESAFLLATIGALVSLLLHGLVEFNFSLPSIPATLAVLSGIGWGIAAEGPREPAADR